MGKSLDELASYMRPLAQRLLDMAARAGLDPVVEDTGRTVEEQMVKVSLGVSWSSKSKHLPQPPEMKSEAIDVAPRACMSMKYWGWNGRVDNSHPSWGKLIQIGEDIGLKNGAHFKHSDPGHFEYIHVPQQAMGGELETA